MAYASPGSQTDPFVTLSYLMDQFKPQVMQDVNTKAQELTQTFDERTAAIEAEIQAGLGGTSPNVADTFSVVTLKKNQTLTCSVGTEMMLRVGSANGTGSAPALVNSSGGTTLSAGSALVTNNMYLVTIDGNGAKAVTDNVKILVRGNYKIN